MLAIQYILEWVFLTVYYSKEDYMILRPKGHLNDTIPSWLGVGFIEDPTRGRFSQYLAAPLIIISTAKHKEWRIGDYLAEPHDVTLIDTESVEVLCDISSKAWVVQHIDGVDVRISADITDTQFIKRLCNQDLNPGLDDNHVRSLINSQLAHYYDNMDELPIKVKHLFELAV